MDSTPVVELLVLGLGQVLGRRKGTSSDQIDKTIAKKNHCGVGVFITLEKIFFTGRRVVP